MALSFGICFFLYFLKLSAGRGFFYNLDFGDIRGFRLRKNLLIYCNFFQIWICLTLDMLNQLHKVLKNQLPKEIEDNEG